MLATLLIVEEQILLYNCAFSFLHSETKRINIIRSMFYNLVLPALLHVTLYKYYLHNIFHNMLCEDTDFYRIFKNIFGLYRVT